MMLAALRQVCLKLLLLLAGLEVLAARAVCQSEVQSAVEWRMIAEQTFPDLTRKDSELSRLYLKETNRLKARDPQFFTNPKWPWLLAKFCYNDIPKNGFSATLHQPKVFSLRPEFDLMGLVVRDQKQNGACALFSVMGCLEFHSAKAGGSIDLSEQYASWADYKVTGSFRGRNHGYSLGNVVKGIQEHGVCPEEWMPYTSLVGSKPSPEAIDDARSRKLVSARSVHEKGTGNGFSKEEINAICSSIASGKPVWCGLQWPGAAYFNRFKAPFLIDSLHFKPAFSRAGHAVVLVGYEKSSAYEGGGRIEFRNSWGPAWGDGGYASFTFQFLMLNGVEAYWIYGAF